VHHAVNGNHYQNSSSQESITYKYRPVKFSKLAVPLGGTITGEYENSRPLIVLRAKQLNFKFVGSKSVRETRNESAHLLFDESLQAIYVLIALLIWQENVKEAA
jgi:hypothetical protein